MTECDQLLRELEERYRELHEEATELIELKNALRFDSIDVEKVEERLDEVDT